MTDLEFALSTLNEKQCEEIREAITNELACFNTESTRNGLTKARDAVNEYIAHVYH